MNRSLPPVAELERRLSALIKSCESLPPLSPDRSRKLAHTPSSKLTNALSVFDAELEGLMLEARLLQSEDSPFTQRRKQKELERAQRLEEARALAEAQFERRARERELEELKAQRAEAEARVNEAVEEPSSIPPQLLKPSRPIPAGMPDTDWDASVDYTVMKTNELPHVDEYEELGLTITPDDSIFTDLPSAPPQVLNSLRALKDSLPPRPSSQVTTPPKPQAIPTSKTDRKQLISLLKGLLPVKPRSSEISQIFTGTAWLNEQTEDISLRFPWEERAEIVWRELNEATILEELEGLTSLSLAPRAFTPAQPIPRRTISLRLQGTDEVSTSSQKVTEEEEFNLSDFEETRDPELREMHETYSALEAKVAAEFNFDSDLDAALSRELEPSLDPPREHLVLDDQDDDEETDFTTLDPDLPLINDPFDLLDDIDVVGDSRGDGFDWEGGTPTRPFADEQTPTDKFDEDSQVDIDMQPRNKEAYQNNNRGLFSRFFGRK